MSVFDTLKDRAEKMMEGIKPEDVKMIHDKEGNPQVDVSLLVSHGMIILTIEGMHIGMTVDDAKGFAVGFAMAVGAALNEPKPDKNSMN